MKSVVLPFCLSMIYDIKEWCSGSSNTDEGEEKMKKKFIMIVLSMLMALTAAACGKKDTSSLVYLKDFDASKYVELGDYKNVEISVEKPTVADEEVERTIQYLLQSRPVKIPVTDRAAKLGDIANIDYEGKLDGVAFEGGTAAGYDLSLGNGGFIEGFEDGVVGMEIGETKDLDLSFPDPYDNNPDLAGKAVVFTVTLNSLSIPETAELNDEFVIGLGLEECSNVEEFRQYLHDDMMERKMLQYEDDKANAIVGELEKGAVYKEAPDGMVDRMKDTLLTNVTVYAQAYGTDVGTYVSQIYGGTAEEYEETLRSQASLMAQRYIMLAAIAGEEGIAVSDEELDGQLVEDAKSAGYNVEDYKAEIDVEAYREYLLIEKMMDYLAETIAD